MVAVSSARSWRWSILCEPPQGAVSGAELVVVLPARRRPHRRRRQSSATASRTVLDTAYAPRSRAGARDRQRRQLTERASTQRRSAPPSRAIPARPASFLLYFVAGTDELTDESKGELAAHAGRAAPPPAARHPGDRPHRPRRQRRGQRPAFAAARRARAREPGRPWASPPSASAPPAAASASRWCRPPTASTSRATGASRSTSASRRPPPRSRTVPAQRRAG